MSVRDALESRRTVRYAAEWLLEWPSSRSLRELSVLLKEITERLARELASPSDAAPRWSSLEWRLARAVAAIHGISPLLARRTSEQYPRDWTSFLQAQAAQTAQRQVRIARILETIHAAGHTAGVPLTALKGAALHASGIYQPGERPMADIDLLVHPSRFVRAMDMLTQVGFRAGARTRRHQMLYLPESNVPAALGESVGAGVKIDLHWCIHERLPHELIDLSAMFWSRSDQPGLNFYPSRASLLGHLLLHAAGAMTSRSLRMLHLHDIHRVSAPMTADDWNELFALRDHAGRPPWWALPPLLLTQRYHATIPSQALEIAARASPRLLRLLMRRRYIGDVSLSHLWVSAFPGLEWSRSLWLMVAYLSARVRPSAEQLRLRGVLAEMEPRVSGGPWADLPQSLRILRWARARPARHATLQPVRAALEGLS